ncbi:hypothetical protein C8R43DRAFT_954149 [Mycena crocata]|nr:hypothetical protein C8R43DRAFT_954149 [Mycena crocata]
MALWEVLAPSGHVGTNLSAYLLEEGFKVNRSDFRSPVVGFNGSLQAPSFPSPPLENDLCFDGPQESKILAEFQQFLDVLGVKSHTSQFDLGGAHRHPRCTRSWGSHGVAVGNLFKSLRTLILFSSDRNEGPSFMKYNIEEIRDCSAVTLNRGGLMLIALLAGGKHSKVFCVTSSLKSNTDSGPAQGVAGCGKAIALSLARQGLGDALFHAAEMLTGQSLRNFLTNWKATVADQLAHDPGVKRGRCYPLLAQKIVDDSTFPDPRVLQYYVHPLTSWSDGSIGPSAFLFHEINLSRFATLCESFFPWGTEPKITKLLACHFYPAVCIQVSQELQLLRDEGIVETSDSHISLLSLQSIQRYKPTAQPAYRVAIATTHLDTRIRSGLLPASGSASGSRNHKSVWLPASLLEYACPEMVQTYHLEEAARSVIGS